DGANTAMIHSINATLSTLKGSHNLRYGADLRLYRAFQNRLGYDVAPAFQFLPTYTKGPLDNSPAAPIGQEFAAFLLGIPDGEMRRSASFATQEKFASFFLQDDWKITSKLTLNLGLRYEYESPVTERFDRAVRGFDATSANPIEAQARANYARNPIAEIPVDQFRVRGGLLFAGGSNGRSLWSGEKGNFLPRVGIAWQTDSKTVVRTGYGLFYDTLGTNRSPAIQTGFTASTPIIASFDNGQTYAGTTANPFPNGLQSPLGAGGGLATNLGQSLTVYPVDRVQPYAQRWSFGLQRQFPGQILLEATYVGNKGIRLPVSRELNFTDPKYLSTSSERDQRTIDFLSQQLPNPFVGVNRVYLANITRADLLKPYPQFGSIRQTDSNGSSWYHGLQTRIERRLSRGYTFQGAYTWSKTMDATQYLNEGDPSPARAVGQFDRTHVFVVSAIWELPFGRGRAFGANMSRALNFIAGGWQLNSIYHWQSGNPLNFGNVILRGSLKDVPLTGDQRSVDRWFNVDLFERAPARQLQNNIRTFPLRFSNIRSDAQTKLDLSVIKFFSVTERVRIQFRAEAFNAMNHVNLNAPNMAVTGTAFGTVTGQGSLSRQFQGVLKVIF
ncbi:MAG: TonB-dependent receptor, partial [Bryobacteraceae bacterium]|nr:TonB-dependent receptor [Bryobacteraceae bacterium]